MIETRFFNSLTHKTETFVPEEQGPIENGIQKPGIVRMYSCGPTVYDFAHIGNFRSFLFADLIRRTLEFMGHEVIHAMNITDVGHMTDDSVADGSGEDKMQVAAQRIKEDKKSGKVPEGAVENPDDPYQIAKYYTNAFLEDARKLGMKIAFEYPQMIMHATEHIDDMLEMISDLIKNGHAYQGEDGVVYYSVESFPDYGKLSGNTLDNLREGSGGRISETNQAHKKHPADFMLWKPDASHIMKWDSPYGKGYPGWHIECSAMARKKLMRDVIDIHTGGEDLIFPHHECEIAQSCGTTGKDYFARFWMHARFLMVEGEKMSKSKGNFFTVRDVLNGKVTGRNVHPAVLRFELTKSHYRANMNFTEKGIVDSAQSVRKLQECYQQLVSLTNNEPAEVDLTHPVLKEFGEALGDDLNIAGALGVVLPWISTKHEDHHLALAVFNKINQVLNVAPIDNGEEQSLGLSEDNNDEETQRLKDWSRQMDEARKVKDWGKADALRNQIQEAGYEVRQSPEGTVIQKKLV